MQSKEHTGQKRNSNTKIVSKDPEEFKTHAPVYYKIEAPDMWYTQLIGRVEFNIKDAMFSNESWKRFLNEYKKNT